MVFAQEFVANGIRTMHRGGCGLNNIFIHTDRANVHMGVGHLGVLDVFVGITYCYHHTHCPICHITLPVLCKILHNAAVTPLNRDSSRIGAYYDLGLRDRVRA